jgi:hypothetical protein
VKLFGRCYDEYDTIYCFVELDEAFFKFLDWVREGLAAVDPDADESTKKVNDYGASFNRIEFTDYNPTFINGEVPEPLLSYLEALDDDDWVLIDDTVPEPEDGTARLDSSCLVMTERGVGWVFQLKHCESTIGTGWLSNDCLEAFRDAAKQQRG